MISGCSPASPEGAILGFSMTRRVSFLGTGFLPLHCPPDLFAFSAALAMIIIPEAGRRNKGKRSFFLLHPFSRYSDIGYIRYPASPL
jgi:hypothetical protein